MTPEEWGRCEDPERMLEFLRGRASERKLRLFAAACCRRVWPLLRDPRSRRAVEAAEEFADGLTARGALDPAQAAAWEAFVALFHAPYGAAAWWAAHAAYEATHADLRAGRGGNLLFDRRAWGEAAWVAHCAAEAIAAEAAYGTAAGGVPTEIAEFARAAARSPEGRCQAGLLRCVFGDPFLPVPALGLDLLAWNGAAVERCGESIYRGRRFDDLPVLADCLEEAGCTDAALLGHLRGPGPHALGCWTLNLILGRG
jgi:hypothetical protein